METTHQTGLMVINEVEKSDVKKIEGEATAQDTAHANGNRKPKADVGDTPLILAIKNENQNLVKRLLGIGADVNHSDRHGQTPITLAVAKSNVAIVGLLLNTDKVNIDIDTGKHRTLFEYASEIAESHYSYNSASLADFAAGLKVPSTTPIIIAKMNTEYPSYQRNLKFKSHRLVYSDRREFRNPIIIKLLILTIKGVDPIRKDEPREQQKVDLSVFEPKTLTIARNRQIA